MTNHVDRFYAAVSVLAGDGHIKQRLIKAYQDNLADIDDEELPVFVKEPFAELKSRLYNVAPLNGEGAVRASVRKMSCTEAGECGVSVVALYTELLSHSDHIDDLTPVSTEDAHPIPPFLVKSIS